MDHIGSLLSKVLKQRGLMKQANASLVVARAQEWIGTHMEPLADVLNVSQLKDGVLVIDCSHSIAAQECHERQEELLSSLREECPNVAIDQIRLVRSLR